MLPFKISFPPPTCNHHLGTKPSTIHIFFTVLEAIGVILCVENHAAPCPFTGLSLLLKPESFERIAFPDTAFYLCPLQHLLTSSR